MSKPKPKKPVTSAKPESAGVVAGNFRDPVTGQDIEVRTKADETKSDAMSRVRKAHGLK